jgi:hypothetical protein
LIPADNQGGLIDRLYLFHDIEASQAEKSPCRTSGEFFIISATVACFISAGASWAKEPADHLHVSEMPA